MCDMKLRNTWYGEQCQCTFLVSHAYFCNPRPSINCCCRPRECYPCSMSGLLLYEACALGLCNATPTFSKVHVNLLEPRTMLCTTPTNPLLYLLVIADICVATYPQYVNSTNSNACLSFSYPGQIQLDCYPGHRVSSCDPVSMLSQNIPYIFPILSLYF